MLLAVIIQSGCSAGSRKIELNQPPSIEAALDNAETPVFLPSPSHDPTPSPSPLPVSTVEPKPEVKLKKSFPILYYHAVNDKINGIEELFVSPVEFEKQMTYLKENNYTVISFDRLKDIHTIEKPVIITFDDGYEDNYKYVYPVLKKFGFPATIFLCSDFIDKPLYLSKAQITEMSGLVDFQGHSITHPYLTKLSNEEVHRELGESKKIIESITAKGVNVFSYPIGDYNQRILDITKKYYKYAVVNGGGLYTEGDGDYEIKRVYIPRILDIPGFSKKIKG
jgi:peptidoglycan/xylan/chitin deacetylase (PgdA/CDA1 family)